MRSNAAAAQLNTLISRARECVRTQDFVAAAAAFAAALKLVPESSVACAGLAHCYGRLGQRREAIAELGRAAGLVCRGRPRTTVEADMLLDLAHELQKLHAPRESLPIIERALKGGASNARAHHLKGQALLRLHEDQAALTSARRARDLAPREGEATLLFAVASARCGQTEDAIRALETLVTSGDRRSCGPALAELARLYDRLGDATMAFDCARRAGATRRAEQNAHEPARLSRELAAQREHCTPAWLATHRARGTDGRADPVFLLGFYRSGTTLAEQVLAAHPALVTSDEAALLPAVQRVLASTSRSDQRHGCERLAALGAGAADALRVHYWRAVEAQLGPLPPHTRLLDKTALNTVHLDLILTLFPGARFVFALRDPRDVLLSCFMQSFAPSPLTAHLDEWREAASFYVTVMEHWEAMRALHGFETVTLRYEDLVCDLNGAIAPVLRFLDLDWHADMGNYQRAARVRVISTPSYADVAQPLYQRAVGRWRGYGEALAEVNDLLAPWIARYGYASR